MKQVVKRDGQIVDFDQTKIENAVNAAFKAAYGKLFDDDCKISEEIATCISDSKADVMEVEDIQDKVEYLLMQYEEYKVAKAYIKYRYDRELKRKANTTDKTILELVRGENKYYKTENSNKNHKLVTTQRDYIAGETSRDLTMRVLLPKEIVRAHESGEIHFHDADYFLEDTRTNCSLINLKDQLDNGTVVNGKMIESPHKLLTAMTITTQIITAVASSQYGGTTVTMTHLAPYVRKSYEKYLRVYREMFEEEFDDPELVDKLVKKFADKALKKEIEDAVQTFNYQINSMSTTNGQTPFVTVFLYLGEDKEYTKEVAMLTEEFFKQRLLGIKNEAGVYVTQEFPKLIYVAEEQNIHEDSEYFWLTKLAAKCMAKRMVPDIISEKKMFELKEGNCFPSMGCVDGHSVIDYKFNGERYVESFERAWNRLSGIFEVKLQDDRMNHYIDTPGIEIWDNKEKKYVKQYRIIRNTQSEWYRVSFTGGRYLDVTNDHPFEIIGKGVVKADDLTIGDKLYKRVANKDVNTNEPIEIDYDMWAKGLVICDGSYDGSVFCSLGLDETDIVKRLVETWNNKGYEVDVRELHRGVKGNYFDVYAKCSVNLSKEYLNEFEGLRKRERHIPKSVFNSARQQKLSFLAGMIDADGYVNDSGNSLKVQIGSTNEELALQQMSLANDLGFDAVIYRNHYTKKDKTKIRYRVEFNCKKELVKYLACEKKINHYDDSHVFREDTNTTSEITEVRTIDAYHEVKYSYDVTTESEHFTVNELYSHNCRSFLAPWKNEKGEYQFYGRFNIGVVTINLVDVALSSHGDMEKFWEIFEDRLENLCHVALKCRINKLKGTLSDVAPILWQHGAFARLKKGEPIDKLIYGGYASISLGYAGLYECVKYMTGKSHTDGAEGEKFGLEVMDYMNKKCDQWKKEENIGYSIYGTPIESTTYKFAKSNREKFGVIEGITDRDYITNSYHVPVFEEIDWFEKLRIESIFQAKSTGGAVSYVEGDDLQDNEDLVVQLIQYIYETILYAELNIKSDYCQVCGYDGEISLIEEGDELIWECPNCKNRNQSKMNVTRRTCGYLGQNFWNQGRTREIYNRVLHIKPVIYKPKSER